MSKTQIYQLHVYWILSIHNMLQICFNIMFLYLYKSWRKRIFISKFKFQKIRFLCLSLISISQKQFKYLTRTYFCGIYGILLELKYLSFITFNFCQNQLVVDRTVDQTGRPMCTRTYTRPAQKAGRPSGRPTETTPTLGQRRSTGQSNDRLCLVDRAFNRSANGQKYDRWAGRPVARPEGQF